MNLRKKTGKNGAKPSRQKSAVPRTAQQSIPMQRMFEDGTCRVKNGYYTRTVEFQDINYQLALPEDRTAIYEEWCSFLNFFDSSIHTEFEKSIRIPFRKDGFDDVRAEYSQMLRQQLSKGNNGLTKRKYLTFGVSGESMQQVKARLDHIQNDLLNNFHRLGVQEKPLDGRERLKLMHGIFNLDGESKFYFDWKKLAAGGLAVKDAIAPTAFAFQNSRTFQMGGIFGAVGYLSITASDLSDQLLKDFLDMDSSQIVTMHVQSVDQNKAIKNVKRTITELDRSTIEEQKKAMLQQDEKEAHHVAAALEIYVKGSLNVFNHRTNVDINNRIVCFDIKQLGKQLKKLGMLIVQDAVWGRVTANRSAGKSTRYYVDEFHLLLKEAQTAAYSIEIWKRFRKWGGLPTAITQNVKDLLASHEVSNIFENSDFVYMLNQANGDRQILAKQLNISPHQLSYVTHSGEGEGLLFYGNTILPFIDRFPHDLELYKIMTTRLSEVSEGDKS